MESLLCFSTSTLQWPFSSALHLSWYPERHQMDCPMPSLLVSRVQQSQVFSLALFCDLKQRCPDEIGENVCHSEHLRDHRIVLLDGHRSCSDHRIGRTVVEPPGHLRRHLRQPDIAIDSGFGLGDERSSGCIAGCYRKPPADSLGISGHQRPGTLRRMSDVDLEHTHSVRRILEALLRIAPADISPHSRCRPL